jgi:hypothetical protein
LGAITYVTLLNAERSYEQARLALVQAQAARYADTAALFAALAAAGGTAATWCRIRSAPSRNSSKPPAIPSPCAATELNR